MRRASLLISLLVGLSFPASGQMLSVDKTSAWVGTQFIVTLNAQNWRDDSEQGMGAILAVGDAKANTSGAYLFPVLTPGGLTETQRSYNDARAICQVTLRADGSAREVQLTAAYPGKANEDLWVYVVELELASGSPPPVFLIGTTVTFTASLLPVSSPTAPFFGAGPTKPDDVYWEGQVNSSTDLTTAGNWGSSANDAGDKLICVKSLEGCAEAAITVTVYAIVDLIFETGSNFLEVDSPLKLKAIFYPAGPPAGQAVWNLTAPTGTTPATTSALVSPPNGEDSGTLNPDVPGLYTIVANCGSSSQTREVIVYRIEWDRLEGHASLEESKNKTTGPVGASNFLLPTPKLGGNTGGSVAITPSIAGNPLDWFLTKNEAKGPSLLIAIEFQTKGSLVRSYLNDYCTPSGDSMFDVYLNLGGASCDVEVSISPDLDASITPAALPGGTDPDWLYGKAFGLIVDMTGMNPPFTKMEYRVLADGTTDPHTPAFTANFILTATSRQKLCRASGNVGGGDGAGTLTVWKASSKPTITISKHL